MLCLLQAFDIWQQLRQRVSDETVLSRVPDRRTGSM
ncbi:hypothetical protein L483_15520 [Pseudomonas putida H8234]|nr:hypothetical protein L483_15520 [Pseudomonas putida H8234]